MAGILGGRGEEEAAGREDKSDGGVVRGAGREVSLEGPERCGREEGVGARVGGARGEKAHLPRRMKPQPRPTREFDFLNFGIFEFFRFSISPFFSLFDFGKIRGLFSKTRMYSLNF